MKTTVNVLLFISLLSLVISVGCDDDEKKGCIQDRECNRGQVCQNEECTLIECESLATCPGSGRTCLNDLKSCSVKECGDLLDGEPLTCDEGLTCAESGAFKYSCLSSNSNPSVCGSTEECTNPERPVCCEGVCAVECMMDVPDMMMDVPDMMMSMPTLDMDVSPPVVSLCSACSNNVECAALGEGAQCTPIGGEGSYCTQACNGNEECPSGYSCIDSLGQCIPEGFACVECLQNPCETGEFCNFTTGICEPPQPLCGRCSEDSGCADGGVCRTLGNTQYCLLGCDDACPEGHTCENNACIPESGQCDACAGQCTDSQYCVQDEARCAECGSTVPCNDGLVCNLMTYTCEESNIGGSCIGDEDCAEGVCVSGECKQCIQNTDCPPQNACNPSTFTCEYSACAGVICQRDSMCDSNTGRCTPGCMTKADCVLPDEMECNQTTGQCYYPDGTCELGGDAVCSPGSDCVPSPLAILDPSAPPACTCRKVDPSDFASPDLIPCHPGITCLDLSAFIPSDGSSGGSCVSF
jgi:hypothetical protein